MMLNFILYYFNASRSNYDIFSIKIFIANLHFQITAYITTENPIGKSVQFMRRAVNGCLCVCRLINARKHSAPNEWGVARTLHFIAVSAILANCTAIAQHGDIYDFRANSTANSVEGEGFSAGI